MIDKFFCSLQKVHVISFFFCKTIKLLYSHKQNKYFLIKKSKPEKTMVCLKLFKKHFFIVHCALHIIRCESRGKSYAKRMLYQK